MIIIDSKVINKTFAVLGLFIILKITVDSKMAIMLPINVR